MGENTDGWNPYTHVREELPDWRVYETELPGGLLGCLDHEKQTIWLHSGQNEVRKRCTLAVEIAFAMRGPMPEDPDLVWARRRCATDWAARKLIDTIDLMWAFRWSTSLPEIAASLRVDLATLRTRLRGLTDDEQDEMMFCIHGARRELTA